MVFGNRTYWPIGSCQAKGRPQKTQSNNHFRFLANPDQKNEKTIKNHQKMVPRSRAKKKWFFISFLYFLLDFGSSGGPFGSHFPLKSGATPWGDPLLVLILALWEPLAGKSCVFDPLRASFWRTFWSFLVEIRAPFCWHLWLFFWCNFQQPNDPTTQQHGKPTHQHPNNPTTQQPNTIRPGGMREAIK